MRIKLSPVRSDQELTVFKQGESLTINGLTLDFSPLPAGGTLPAEATGCEWLAGPVERVDGQLIVALTMPHGADAPEEARFPADIVGPVNGKVPLPIPDALHPSPSQGYAQIEWDQVVTAEAKAEAYAAQVLATAMADIAQRRAIADAAIAPLQDSVDLDAATPDEVELLKAWKRYRIALSRLHEQPGYPTDIEWPAPPA